MENQVKRTERGDNIKFEDMTLAQIKNLKAQIVKDIFFAINKAVNKYDVGEVMLYADCDVFRSDSTDEIIAVNNQVLIKFSKEDD